MSESLRRASPTALSGGSARHDDDLVCEAARFVEQRLAREGIGIEICGKPAPLVLGLLRLATRSREYFCVAFLDDDRRLLGFETLFAGTIDAAHVYSREVCSAALDHGATRCLLYHNHPFGPPEPSQADIQITKLLVEALEWIGVTVEDHIIVGLAETPTRSIRIETGLVGAYADPAGRAVPEVRDAASEFPEVEQALRTLGSRPSSGLFLTGPPSTLDMAAEALLNESGRDQDYLVLLTTRLQVKTTVVLPRALSGDELARACVRSVLEHRAASVVLVRNNTPGGFDYRQRRDIQCVEAALAKIEARVTEVIVDSGVLAAASNWDLLDSGEALPPEQQKAAESDEATEQNPAPF